MTSSRAARAKLKISAELDLPIDAITNTLVIFGGKGMGKTNLLSVLAEEVAHAGQRFSIIDPMGVCWGLRHSADGKGPGLEILILGGRRGDIPIEPTGGAVVADLVVDEDVSVVIDISRRSDGRSWGKNEKIRFVRDYVTRLFERQGERCRPLLQIVDECARFCPQMVRANEVHTAECMGAIAQMVEEGRNIGLGVCLVSQRSARLNKDVAELADVMLAFRTVGPNSVNAILDWFGEHVPKEHWKGLVEQLRSLPRGTALVVSPGWLKFEGSVAIRRRETFDSSATPKSGEQRRAAGPGAMPDLARYQQRMQETIERVKANDPRELLRQIAELKKQLAKPAAAPAPKPAPPAKPKVIRIPILKDGQFARLEKLLDHTLSSLRAATSQETFLETLAATPAPEPRPAAAVPPLPSPPRTPHRTTATTAPQSNLGKCERAILTVLAQHPSGCTKGKLALLSGYRYSGGFRNSLSALRKLGLIVGENDALMTITPAGEQVASDSPPLPQGQALIDYWLTHPSLGKCERAVLKYLTDKFPGGFTGPLIASGTDYEFSGGFRNALSTLRTAGLIEGSNLGAISASAHLFS